MLNLSGYKLTFDDEFNNLSVSQTGAGSTWADIRSQWRFDAYSDIGFGKSSFMDAGSGYNPFSLSGGALSITASPDNTPYGYPGSWESGLLSSKASFSQTYGYFEVRADFSDTLGAWDGFWLLPENPTSGKQGWQELDVAEHYGSDPTGVYSTIHTTDSSTTPQVYSSHPTLAAGYHTYGMDWEKDTIKFYVDGVLTGTEATPSDMHGPMYLLADLATRSYVGATGAPMVSKIDYIRAYSSDPNAQAVALGTVSAPDGRDPGMYGATSLATTVSITAQTLAKDTGVSATDNITNNGAVTLSGTVSGATGTSVEVLDGAAVIGTATLGTSGAWSYQTTLAAGTHTLSAAAVSPSGTVAATAAGQAPITVVSAGPTIAMGNETVAPNGAASFSGTWTGASGTTVALYDGATALGPAKLDSNGNWFLSTTLSVGSHSITATATDLAGNSASVDPTVDVAAASDTLTLVMSEDAYQGNAQFTVTVDGTAVGGVQTVTAQNRYGQTQAFTLTGDFGTGNHTVGINYLNDLYVSGAGDRNLRVKTITLDGTTTVENRTQWSQGLVNYKVATPVTKPDVLVVAMSEDAYKGDAQFVLTVDGVQVGGVQTATASHVAGQTQLFTFTGDFGTGAHSIGINYKNDLHTGSSASTDRNLYVSSIALDGATTTLNAAQKLGGLATYQVRAPSDGSTTSTLPAVSVPAAGTLVLDHDAGSNAAVTFQGAGGTAQLTDAASFKGSISGFGTGDTIDLRSIAFTGKTAFCNVTNGAGTLAVTNGTSMANLNLQGQYSPSDFHLQSDGMGGTAITFAR